MKKILSLLFVLLLVLSLVGCGETGERKNIFNNSSKEEEIEFQRGEVSGNCYQNDAFDITFNLPEGWLFKSDDEIAEIMGQASDMLDSEKFDKATEGETICFMAAEQGGSNNVNLSFIKGGVFVSEKASMDSSIKMISEQYEQMGAEVTIGETYENKIGKHKFLATDIIVALNGVELHQTLNIKSFGKYIASISLTSDSDGDPVEFCKYFA